MIMMDFSVVTVCFNSEKTIKETICSVLRQKNVNFEYIIIDGGSSDSTLDIVKSFNDPRIKFISEKDKGLYDAMNKGINMANGSIVAIINSDDVYVNDSVLDKVKSKMEREHADIVSGHIYYFEDDVDCKERKYQCVNYINKSQWYSGWQPPHPSTFIKLKVYKEIGLYNIKYRISADYDFLFRALYINDYKISLLDEYLVAMRTGGESTQSLKAIIRGNKEVLDAWKINNIKPPKLLIAKKLINKLMNSYNGS